MIAGRASLTAVAAALARGDHLPPALLPAPLRAGLNLVQRAGALGRALSPLLRLGSLGLVEHIALRTAAIDAAIEAVLRDGVEQVVILGAGLDRRAWRMRALGGAKIIEVDHPATQATKRAWLERATPLARSVRFVAADLERESISAPLEGAGFDRTARTLWVWEAVVAYLSRTAIGATLRDIGRMSAPGTVLVVTYLEPELLLGPVPRRLAERLFAAFGEPIAGAVSRAAMRAMLAEHCFRVHSDTGPTEWPCVSEGARPALFFSGERLAIAGPAP